MFHCCFKPLNLLIFSSNTTQFGFNFFSYLIITIFCSYIGGESAADCQPCSGGKYCGTTGLVEPTGNCSRGYYCPDNDTISTPTPTGLECWVGYYCLEGSSAPTPCAPGFFSETNGSYACTPCPAGYYCTSGVSPDKIECPPYKYCEEGRCLVYHAAEEIRCVFDDI